MKKTLFLGALLLAAVVFTARPSEAKRVVKSQVPVEKTYKGIRVSSMVNVVLDDRDPTSVEVCADARVADRLVVEVKRGILVIRMKDQPKRQSKRKNKNYAPTMVYVGREPIRSVEVSGMSSLTGEKGLRGEELSVSVSGMSEVKTPMECGQATLQVNGMSKLAMQVHCSGTLEVVVNGMSKASLSGQTVRLEAEVSGMSKLNADDLDVTEYADCAVGGMSKVKVTCDGELMARANGMSKLTYSGNCTLAPGCRIGDSSLEKR